MTIITITIKMIAISQIMMMIKKRNNTILSLKVPTPMQQTHGTRTTFPRQEGYECIFRRPTENERMILVKPILQLSGLGSAAVPKRDRTGT